MGILKAISNSFSGAFADQYKEIIIPNGFDEHTLVSPGIVKNSRNNNSTPGVISNGSIIGVPENTAAYIFDKNGIEQVITSPGGYKYENGEDSIFNGDGIGSVFNNAFSRVGFAGNSSEMKQIAYINLREIRDIKFGTRGPQIYNDLFYGTDLEILSYGSFTIKVVDTDKFVRNFLPAGVSYYSMDDDSTRSQIVSEFLQSFIVALNSLSSKFRISQLPSQANEISKAISEDKNNAGSWGDRFGFVITKVAIENIEFSDKSKELVNKYSENKMNIKAYEDVSQTASNIAAQQKIAEGIKDNGLGDGGNMIFGMNMAQSLNQNAQQKSNNDFDSQVQNLKKLKELLDAGILTEDEFNAKKKEIMGL